MNEFLPLNNQILCLYEKACFYNFYLNLLQMSPVLKKGFLHLSF